MTNKQREVSEVVNELDDILKKWSGEYMTSAAEEEFIKTLTADREAVEKKIMEETKICTREGIHTCRLGAIHPPDNFCGTLQALTNKTE